MLLILYKTLAAIAIFITSSAAVIYPLKKHTHPTHHLMLELGDAFASGIFLGAALFHMLPDAIQEFAQILGKVNYPLPELLCASGYLMLLFFERISGGMGKASDATISYAIAIIIILHSLIEGAALGVNTAIATAFIIFIAIIAHKSSESFALAMILNRSRLSRKHIIGMAALFLVMTPLGIALGSLLSHGLDVRRSQLFTAVINAFAAGTFLYISTLHHINHHQRSHQGEGVTEFFSLLMGLVLMAGLAIWI